MAELATTKRDYEQAIRAYKEALSHDGSHVKVRLYVFTFLLSLPN